MKNKIGNNLRLIFSYGAMLLLGLQKDPSFLVVLAVFFLGGAWLIIRKNPPKERIAPTKRRSVTVKAAFLTLSFGLYFFIRWANSPGFIRLANRFSIDAKSISLLLSLCLSASSFYFIYNAVIWAENLRKKQPSKKLFLIHLILGWIASFVTVVLSQVMLNAENMMMGAFKFFLAVIIVYVVFLFCYALTGLIRSSMIVSTLVFMILSTITTYLYQFRQRLLEPTDFFSAGTALDVIDNYNLLPIPPALLMSWLFYIGFMLLLCYFAIPKPWLTIRKRAVAFGVCLVGVVSVALYSSANEMMHWDNYGALSNGFILNFTIGIAHMKMEKPQNYSMEFIEDLSSQYAQTDEPEQTETDRPHIIVIMDESFSDLYPDKALQINEELTPFISSLKENTISGYALCSVFGGNTSSSEYEFLTGNSMAWFPDSSVPYQQFVHSPTYSAVSYLQSKYHYRCLALHPFSPDNWNRNTAYKYLGFEEFRSIDYFQGMSISRRFISDKGMFEKVIDTFEENRESPLFLFGVSMQNHGGYSETRYQGSISLSGYKEDYPQTEQYLSLIHETDKAVEYLIQYFSSVDDKVVIVFFGDHQPSIESGFYDEIHQNSDALTNIQKKHQIPFFIWTNYQMESKTVERTSLNYLSSYMYEAAGLELPVYNRFLSDMETVVPAINANGYYSKRSDRYLTFDKASEEESKWFEKYKILQYNSVFDKKHISHTFFPAPGIPDSPSF